MDNNIQSSGLNTILNGPFEPTFYKNIDLEDMLNYLLTIRKYQKHNSRSLVNYFQRYRDIFFGLNPAEILKFSPHKRSWILAGRSSVYVPTTARQSYPRVPSLHLGYLWISSCL
jgi:hypothetical protein